MGEWNENYFSDLYAEIYQKWLIPKERTETETEAIKLITGMNKSHLVLDVAAGYGRHACRLAGTSKIVAIDFSQLYMKMAKHKGNDKLRCAVCDMRNLSFKSDTFDYLLLLFSSFGYFDVNSKKDQNLDMLLEFRRVLKDDGEMLLEIPNPESVCDAVSENTHSLMTNGVYEVEEEFYFDPEFMTLENKTVFRKGKRHEESSYRLFLYDIARMKKELTARGFKILKVYGDYEGSSFRKNVSDIALFHCKKN
ncbi:MAG: class I SAM-dependent methyltransferase [Candidatus Sumerlaeales bacterium]|nr:class I SAM-dependent methyltransferase [Candidatus Sumerlaeales bacterium]